MIATLGRCARSVVSSCDGGDVLDDELEAGIVLDNPPQTSREEIVEAADSHGCHGRLGHGASLILSATRPRRVSVY